MKPNFALSLSFDGIRLLQRAAGGWYRLGEVSVADPALPAALAALRESGEAVATGVLTTKLIIPDEQIKYLTIDTRGLDEAARREAARAALDGATPYPVDALAFDISPDGDATHVAAVARETLQEVEAFALQHGFAPVSFVAAGRGAEFLGEPFFGPTAHAKALLPPGSQVEPDGVRVVIVEKPVQEVAEESVAQAKPEPTPEQAAPDSSSDPIPGEAASAAPVDASPDRAVAAPDLADNVSAAETAPEPEVEPEVEAEVEVVDDPETSAEVDVNAASHTDADETAEPTTPPLLGFATRRRQDPSSTQGPLRLGGVSRGTATAHQAPPVANISPETTATKDTPQPPRKSSDETSLTAPPKSATDSLRPSTIPPVAPPPLVAPPKPRPGRFLSRRKVPPAAKEPSQRAAARVVANAERSGKATLETERMTVFGARGDGTVGGKPRYLGLILMAVLVVFLAGVAAWASVFLEDGLARLFPRQERTLASTLPDDTRASLAKDVGATTNLEPDFEEEADDVVVAALNDSLSEDGLSAEDAAVLDALRDPLPDPVAPEELDAAALEARYAVTGIWPKAPEIPEPTGPIEIEDLYVTGIDPVSPALDAVALPGVASFQTDRQLAIVTSPAAAGTNFARDAQGRIIPTIEGALSPDGFTVYLGRPPAEPPATLARLDPGEAVNPNVNALTQVRPQIRPTDLVEQNERATLGGLSRIELAGLRPRLRPQAPQEVRELQQEEIEEDVQPSPLATAVSLRPETRPRNFDRLVARAAPTPAPQAEPARVASVAPRTVTPSIPSSASVAREATVRNALNMHRVNLIGVYGTPSNRRALVRLPNGRYQKVEVGDRFDGGRVSAIGDAELRYQKSGRNLVLKMPQG